jgi:hypothetical protein
MIIIIYVVSIIAFNIAALILPLLFIPIIRAIKGKDEIIFPGHPLLLAVFIASTVNLLFLTRVIWANWGYNPGWIFPTIIAVQHFVMGGVPGANKANQAQAQGVMFGVIIYAILRLFL